MAAAGTGQSMGQGAPGIDTAFGAGLDGQPRVATESAKDHGQARTLVIEADLRSGKSIAGQPGDQLVPADAYGFFHCISPRGPISIPAEAGLGEWSAAG